MIRDVVMLGFLVSESKFARISALDRYPQVAARNLERGYLEGFLANGINVELVSAMPASTFPLNSEILFGKEQWNMGAVTCQSLRYVNLPGLKGITRFVSALICLAGMFLGRKVNHKILCVYSLHSPYLLAANLLHRFLHIKYFVIVPDLPEFMSVGLGRNWLYSFLKRIDRNLIRLLIKQADGVTVVAEAMLKAMPELDQIPSVLIEGIALDCPLQNDVNEQHLSRPYFLYSGGLNEAYGVGDMIRAFHASELDAELWLFGNGPLARMIEEKAAVDQRIRYFGFVAQKELRKYQAGATALLLTRMPKDEFVRFSFPSKLLEYMMSGVPVITTKLPGIPDEYFKYLSVVDNFTPNGFVRALRSHLDRGELERIQQAQRAQQFVKNKKTPKAIVAKFIRLIDANA